MERNGIWGSFSAFFASLLALERFLRAFFESSLISEEKAKDGLRVPDTKEDESEGDWETIIVLQHGITAIFIPSLRFTPIRRRHPLLSVFSIFVEYWNNQRTLIPHPITPRPPRAPTLCPMNNTATSPISKSNPRVQGSLHHSFMKWSRRPGAAPHHLLLSTPNRARRQDLAADNPHYIITAT